MTPEFERKALDIVSQLTESPATDRDRLQTELCGQDAELMALVRKLAASQEAIKQTNFLARPALLEVSQSILEWPPTPADGSIADAQASNGSGALEESVAAGSDSSVPSTEPGTSSRNSLNAPKAGRFQPSELLGRGGQGEVWRALDPVLDRDIALKVVRCEMKGSQSMVAKFQREAEITGKLEHPNIVPVYEAGKESADGSPYYVMRICVRKVCRRRLTRSIRSIIRRRTMNAVCARYSTGSWMFATPWPLHIAAASFIAISNRRT
ncbi:MAG: hypothetical protein O3A00_18025 [Planctomycetota bacterium]|nr:hypothetical protein [Planctomycetota bacterium]